MRDAADHQNALKLFYSYAYEDEQLRQQLEKHLILMQRDGLIEGWHNHQISPGTAISQAISTHLNTAQIILLLISSDFLSSNYCYSTEMKRALERHAANEARVIPILLRPCDWQHAPFSHLQPLPLNKLAITKWPDRDEAFLDVVTSIRKVIQELVDLHPPSSESTSPHIFSVPFARNPFFTGREDILAHLHTLLRKDKTAAITQPQTQAISGLGGVGKTQTAVEYAYRHQHEYSSIFWVKAETREEIISDFLSIAALLNLPEKHASDQSRIVAAVKRWLEQHTGWLLIFDNADHLALVREYFPSGHTGHILLTTRTQALGHLAHKVEIEKMEADEGALFLLRRANLINQDEPLDKAKAADIAKAKEIVQAVDGLPLALDQAGAYIDETSCSLAHYLNLYHKQHAKLLKRRGTTVAQHDHPKPVATTWEISFQKVEEANPAAADLLRLCAFLAPDAIPEEIITEGADELGPTLQAVAKDEFELDAAIEELRKYSLIKRDRDAQTLTVHRLVQVVLRDEMDEQTRKQWAERAVRAVDRVFPSGEYGTWAECERLLLHAQICAELIDECQMEFEEASRLLNQVASYLQDRGQYTQAEPLYRRALTICEKILEPEHPDVALSLNNLAELYRVQGKYEQAEPLYRRGLAIDEKAYGLEHPEVATDLNNLALLYKTQGKYEQAEPLYERAMAIREKVLEPEHPDVALSLNNLASLYWTQGKYEQAEPLYERAMAIREKVLEPEHPDVASSLNNLASLYWTQGKYEQAEPLLQRALAICEKVLEPEHPDVASSLNNLASLYQDQGKYEQAEPLLQRALAICEKVLEPEHPDVASSLNNLGAFYNTQGQYEQAEPLYRRALLIRQKVLEPKHPDIANSLENLAWLYENQGKYFQAEPFYQQALAMYEQAFGVVHPHVARVMENYAHMLPKMGREDEAEELEKRAREIRERLKNGG